MSAVQYSFRKSGSIGVAVLTVNHPPVNSLSHAVRLGIVQSVSRALSDANVAAMVLTGSGATFPAGADITEFSSGKALEEPTLSQVVNTLEISNKPVVAALHGTALGGGLEIALGCHYRIALDSSRLGLPEVHLGILPGASGTQRLPRLIGARRAIDMIVTGANINAKVAKQFGLVDVLIPSKGNSSDSFDPVLNLLSEAVKFAAQVTSKPVDDRRVSKMQVCDREEFRDATAWSDVHKKYGAMYRGYEAPKKCIEAVHYAVDLPFDKGMEKESEILYALFKSEQAKALQHVFFAERQVNKVPGIDIKEQARPIRSVGVLGAGTMGSGIAMNFIENGIPVVLVDTEQSFVDRGLDNIRKIYSQSVEKGKASQEQVDKRFSLLTPSINMNDFAKADIVIEAVFEDMPLKKKVFAQLDKICKPGAVLASNTSTLSIDEIASCTSRPEDVVGTHFFSPANVMKLLENVRGSKSSPSTIATVMKMSKSINKVGVLVGNCDGFVGNRMLEGYSREANFLLEEGALPFEVDAVIRNFGMAMGPFQMGDLAGNDVGWRIRKGKGMDNPVTRKASEGRYCEIADKLCDLGRFGMKTGQGWYKYQKGDRKPVNDPEIEKLIVQHSLDKGIARRKIEENEIFERCMYPLINEGFKILEEGIALRPSDIDIIWIYGYGFPRYRGGPMHFAESRLSEIYTRLVELYRLHPNSHHFKPSKLLQRLASENLKYNSLASKL